jgi:SAM-dependent methyltransferase
MRFPLPLFAKKKTASETVFSRIYTGNEWVFGSGDGSLPSSTEEYRSFLQSFLREHRIRSVVDVGCGDWQFSRLLDWSGVEYLGIDVVDEVIKKNSSAFAGPNVRFLRQDVLESRPPPADLLLLKDVLQHWPFAAIESIISWFPSYRYILVTNEALIAPHQDTEFGGYRPLDLREDPFFMPMTEVLRFGGPCNVHGQPWTKVTLFYQPAPLSQS